MILFAGFLDGIPYSPKVLPTEWCAKQPCWDLGSFVISQPSSSLIVYLTAAIGIWIGWSMYTSAVNQQSKRWFGISLFLGGFGAFLAGTSYQAFGYEIKCAGREECIWTSWWELGYELLTVLAAAYLLIAVVKMCFSERWLNISKGLALLLSSSYLAVLIIGVMQQSQILLSFELMLLFSTPLYVLILVANSVQYFQTRNNHIGKLTITWLMLFGILICYYAYLMLGITSVLWKQGIWFSENDVLHVGMIIWLLYIHFVLRDSIRDNVLRKP